MRRILPIRPFPQSSLLPLVLACFFCCVTLVMTPAPAAHAQDQAQVQDKPSPDTQTPAAETKDTPETSAAPDGSAPPAEDSKAPKIEKIGEHEYRLGEITFNGMTREIRFPAQVNMEEGLVEYVLVNENGKIHESVLATKISPAQLHIALKLCHYETGEGRLFDVLYTGDELEERQAAEAKRGSAVEFQILGKDGEGNEVALSANELVQDIKDPGEMKPGPWIYTGSTIYEGTFLAESEGSILAVYLDTGALFNNPREGRDDDERWIANKEKIPPFASEVTVLIKPAEKELE